MQIFIVSIDAPMYSTKDTLGAYTTLKLALNAIREDDPYCFIEDENDPDKHSWSVSTKINRNDRIEEEPSAYRIDEVTLDKNFM